MQGKEKQEPRARLCPGLSREPGKCRPKHSLGPPGRHVIGGSHPFNVRFSVGGNPMRMARLLSLVVATVLLFASVPICAQQPGAAPPPQSTHCAPINLQQAEKGLARAEAAA